MSFVLFSVPKKKFAKMKDFCTAHLECQQSFTDFLLYEITGLGELGVRLDSGEKITIACKSKRTNAVDMQIGCHENRSDPGLAR